MKPEPSGHPGDETVVLAPGPPPRIESLHYEFDWWLGDDLVGAYPFFLVTERLRRALEALDTPTGFGWDEVKVTVSPFFLQTNPGRSLPRFFWLKVVGKPATDDIGLSKQSALIVSGRVLTVLLGFCLEQAEIYQYRSRS